MAIGYVLGPLFRLDASERKPFLIRLGAALTVGFILLRFLNVYGDPAMWSVQDNFLSTVLSFINFEKYPPSLLYLMSTLGPAMILLALLENAKGKFAGIIINYGRVPFLFYIVHFLYIHALAYILAWMGGGYEEIMFDGFAFRNKPADFGVNLVGVYFFWLVVVSTLYPLCRWFAGIKRKRRDWWLSYL